MSQVFQVNAAPTTAIAQSALKQASEALAHDPQAVLAVFFYFDGVAHAHEQGEHAQQHEAWTDLAGRYQLPLLICQTAWQRRFQQLPGGAFRLSSLTDWMLWLEKSAAVECFGGGVAACNE